MHWRIFIELLVVFSDPSFVIGGINSCREVCKMNNLDSSKHLQFHPFYNIWNFTHLYPASLLAVRNPEASRISWENEKYRWSFIKSSKRLNTHPDNIEGKITESVDSNNHHQHFHQLKQLDNLWKVWKLKFCNLPSVWTSTFVFSSQPWPLSEP